MKRLKDLLKDTLTYGTATIVSQVASLLLLPLYTSYLSPKDYGIIALVAYIKIFFSPIASLGTTNAVFRRFNLGATAKDQNITLSTGFFFVLVNSIFLFIVLWFGASLVARLLLDSVESWNLIRIVAVTSLLAAISNVLNTTLRAKRKVEIIAIIRIVSLLVSIGATIYLVMFKEMGVLGVLYGQLIGSAFSFILQLFFSLEVLRPIFSFVELRAMLSYGIPFLPHRLFSRGLPFLGLFFIKEYLGLETAGLFDIALKICLPITFVVNAVQASWTPLKFQIHREDGIEAKDNFKKLISIYFVLWLSW